jgi:hypothetical protein
MISKRLFEESRKALRLPPKSPILGDFKPFLSKSPRMGDLGGGSEQD